MDPQTVVKRVKRALSSKIRVKSVYLFGSRARGSYREDSDYDIAVVSPDFAGMDFLERQRLARPLVRKVLGDVPLDVVCYTEEEFEMGRKAFLPAIIEEEGVAA